MSEGSAFSLSALPPELQRAVEECHELPLLLQATIAYYEREQSRYAEQLAQESRPRSHEAQALKGMRDGAAEVCVAAQLLRNNLSAGRTAFDRAVELLQRQKTRLDAESLRSGPRPQMRQSYRNGFASEVEGPLQLFRLLRG